MAALPNNITEMGNVSDITTDYITNNLHEADAFLRS
jgi:hypothetical protein